MQVVEVAPVVHPEGAARARLVGVGLEHEVVDQQLASALEEVDQPDLAARALEGVVLGDLDHRQPAPGRVDLVAVPGQGLLLLEQLAPCGEPALAFGDLRIGHVVSPCTCGSGGGWIGQGAGTGSRRLPRSRLAATTPSAATAPPI